MLFTFWDQSIRKENLKKPSSWFDCIHSLVLSLVIMSTDNFYETWAFAKPSKEGDFEKIKIARGGTGPDDVEFDIKFCGICHSDVHIAQDELEPFLKTKYPCVPGHELAGVVTKVDKLLKMPIFWNSIFLVQSSPRLVRQFPAFGFITEPTPTMQGHFFSLLATMTRKALQLLIFDVL